MEPIKLRKNSSDSDQDTLGPWNNAPRVRRGQVKQKLFRWLLKFLKSFTIFVALVFFWLITPEKEEFRPSGRLISNHTCYNDNGNFTTLNWKHSTLGSLKSEYSKVWNSSKHVSSQPLVSLEKTLSEISSLGKAYSFANLDAYPILRSGQPVSDSESRKRYNLGRYSTSRSDGRICFSNLPNGNDGEGPGQKPFDKYTPEPHTGWFHAHGTPNGSGKSRKKYLIVLAEKNERLDFVNNFHASLLAAGGAEDTKTIVWTHDPCRRDYVLLVDHYRSEYDMDIELRQMPDAVMVGKGEGAQGWVGGGMKIEYARFMVYRELLERIPTKLYEMVMFSDYDVVFQKHPFKHYPVLEGGLSMSAEWRDFTIGDCQHHRGWIKCGEPWWGEGTMYRMKPFPRLCAGVVVGYTKAMVKLSQILTSEILLTSCNDQGILNYLYYSCRLSQQIPNVMVWSNEDGLGGTIGSNPHYWVNGWGDVINHAGQVQVWIHQVGFTA
jgi:hypothetical protein